VYVCVCACVCGNKCAVILILVKTIVPG